MKLKKQVQQLKKELQGLELPKKKDIYTFEDWTYEEILKVVFPEDGEILNPNDEELIKKWNQTDWSDHPEYLALFSDDELTELEDWAKAKEQERGAAEC
jgi:hypothetical protein